MACVARVQIYICLSIPRCEPNMMISTVMLPNPESCRFHVWRYLSMGPLYTAGEIRSYLEHIHDINQVCSTFSMINVLMKSGTLSPY